MQVSEKKTLPQLLHGKINKLPIKTDFYFFPNSDRLTEETYKKWNTQIDDYTEKCQ